MDVIVAIILHSATFPDADSCRCIGRHELCRKVGEDPGRPGIGTSTYLNHDNDNLAPRSSTVPCGINVETFLTGLDFVSLFG